MAGGRGRRLSRSGGRWLAALALVAAAASAAVAQQFHIAIATGGPAGVYYPLGVGMAEVLSKYLPGVSSTARVTGGSIDNLKLIGSNGSDIALSMADAALDALRGRGQFKSNKIEVRTLMALYPNRLHVVTLEGKGITSMLDLKGKRVSVGGFGSATEVVATRVLAALGLDGDNSVQRERLTTVQATEALREGKIDAFFWVGGLPTAAVADFAAMPGVKIKLIDSSIAVAALNKRYGEVYSAGIIPANTYTGQSNDSTVVVVQNILVADARLSDRVAYDVVKTLIEKRDELIAAHVEAKSFAIENQTPKNSLIPWHPGALKYLKEKGVAM